MSELEHNNRIFNQINESVPYTQLHPAYIRAISDSLFFLGRFYSVIYSNLFYIAILFDSGLFELQQNALAEEDN